uniref:Histone-lysine N-methyltransferase n=1 Tax=Strigamia maritima TaxID=126957 RepID=T1J8Q7_STRMM
MTVQQKSRYTSRFDNGEKTFAVELKAEIKTATETSSEETLIRKRAHKPSKRFLEAVVSNIYPSPRSSKKSPKSSPTSEQHCNKEIISEKLEPISSVKKFTDKAESNTGEEVTSENHLNGNLPVEMEAAESCASVSSLGSTTSSRSNVETRFDRICQVCLSIVVSGSKNFVKCEGACNLSFHKDCINLTNEESTFKCSECIAGIHTCFACKEKSEDTRKCFINQCGRFYHESCLKKYPAARIDSKCFICPLHMCVSCIPDIPWKEHIVHRGRMMRCIRCPTAYHVKDSCLAAGTEVLTSSSMVCPSHYDKNERHKQINVNWCFICSSGGSLICCESCPAAFHAECLHIDPPEGNYYCRDCALGRQPKFGDIVWVKLGCYRWWPARILHPKLVPENIQALKHQVGEFPVEFFGSHDYYWTNRSRVFLYQEGDKGNENATGRALAKTYDKALHEAMEAFIQWKVLKETREDKCRVNQRPPPFKIIKTNKPVGKVQALTCDPLEGTQCECNPTSENPCSSDSDCLNRMVMFECNAAVCPAGEKCCNQRFQKRQYAETVPFKTTNRGWGLKASKDIPKGHFVIEYVGELIDEDECKERMKKMHEMDKTDYYFLTLDKDRIIDAGQKGNLARYMNHSCQPNCETQKWTVNGDTRVGLFAVCDIPSGTELTFNYYLDCLANEKRPCNCQAPLCSGFIGIRPKISTNGSTSNDVKKVSEVRKKKNKKPS